LQIVARHNGAELDVTTRDAGSVRSAISPHRSWRSCTPACNQTPEQIVETVIAEDADAIGLSVLQIRVRICRCVSG